MYHTFTINIKYIFIFIFFIIIFYLCRVGKNIDKKKMYALLLLKTVLRTKFWEGSESLAPE